MLDTYQGVTISAGTGVAEVRETPPPKPLSCGDVVHVLFWRPSKMPDGRDLGQWDTVVGRVVNVGTSVCYEITHAGLPSEWANTAPWLTPQGSTLRFVDPADAFPTEEDALEAAKTRTPPAATR